MMKMGVASTMKLSDITSVSKKVLASEADLFGPAFCVDICFIFCE